MLLSEELHSTGRKMSARAPKKNIYKRWNKGWSKLELWQNKNSFIPTPKNIRKSWRAATSISTQSWGGSYGLSKSLKWKRNVTGDPKANGFCHWLERLLKIARDDIFSEKISLCKCLYYNQDSTDGILFKLRRVVFKRRERDRASERVSMMCISLPASKTQTQSSVTSYLQLWLQNGGKNRGRHIYFSDLRHSQFLAVNHKATCCQLCVVTCAAAACEQKAFILLQLPHPRKVFFSRNGRTGKSSEPGEASWLSAEHS